MISRKQLILSVLWTLSALFFAATAQAQCQTCAPYGTPPNVCLRCVGATSSGGYVCSTYSCTGCTVQFPCTARAPQGLTSSGASKCTAPGETQTAGQATLKPEAASFSPPLKIDAPTIRAIAARHPRFALTFLMTNEGGGLVAPWTEAHWLPFELTAADVERVLGGGALSASQPDGPAGDPPSQIIYRITVEASTEADVMNLQLEQVAGSFAGDPALKLLEMKLRLRTAGPDPGWSVESWQVQ